MSYSIFSHIFRQISRDQKHDLEAWVAEHEQRTSNLIN